MKKEDDRKHILDELVPDFQLKVAGWQDVRFIVTPGHGYLEVEDNPENRQFFSPYSYERGGKLYLEEDDDASKWLKSHGLDSYKDIPTVYAEDDRSLKFLMASRKKQANCKKAEEETVRQEGGQYIGWQEPLEAGTRVTVNSGSESPGYQPWDGVVVKVMSSGTARMYSVKSDTDGKEYAVMEQWMSKAGAKTAAALDPSREFLEARAKREAYSWSEQKQIQTMNDLVPDSEVKTAQDEQQGLSPEDVERLKRLGYD